MESNKIAIVIPAYNEAGSIGEVVTELFDLVGSNLHVLIVNDCSTDDTSSIAKSFGATVLDLDMNLGYAGAINEGLLHACNQLDVEFLVTMDADGQHHPSSVKNLIEILVSSQADLVVGTRQSAARLSEWLYGQYYNYCFKILDPLCGLKGYRKSVYLECGAFETFDSIGTEMLTRALLSNKYVEQVPVKIRFRKDKSRFGSGCKINKRIILSLFKSIMFIKSKNQT